MNSTKKYNNLNKAAKDFVTTQEKISKGGQGINTNAVNTAKNWTAIHKNLSGSAQKIESIFRTLRTMATGGGGLGPIGQLAGSLGMIGGTAGTALGASLGALLSTIGFAVSQATSYRQGAAAAAGVGLNSPFTSEAYGNFCRHVSWR